MLIWNSAEQETTFYEELEQALEGAGFDCSQLDLEALAWSIAKSERVDLFSQFLDVVNKYRAYGRRCRYSDARAGQGDELDVVPTGERTPSAAADQERAEQVKRLKRHAQQLAAGKG